jgi:chromosome condensin MukBEF ATPase and DNA-binding subunit MukB
MFLFILRDKMNINLDTLLKVSFEWEDRVNEFDRVLVELGKRLDNSERRYDRKNDELLNVLEKIGSWQKFYEPSLKANKREYDKIHGAIKKVPKDSVGSSA